MLMGNRGILHRQLYGPVKKDWQHKSWVACRMNFGAWQRGVKMDGKLRLMTSLSEYSELFFLDEATALSAGHRPCGTCRKTDYTAFKSAWCKAKEVEESEFETKLVDCELHHDRCAGQHDYKQTSAFKFNELPDGAIFLSDGSPHLRWKGKVWLWTARGYIQGESRKLGRAEVEVLTPKAMLGVLRAGYAVQVHRSAAFA